MTDRALPRLGTIAGYPRYLSARIAAWIGNVMSLVALPVLIYQLTGSAALTGLLAAAGALPYLLLGLPAGALADRWDSRRTMPAGARWPGSRCCRYRSPMRWACSLPLM